MTNPLRSLAILILGAFSVAASAQSGSVITQGLTLPIDAAADPTHPDRFFIVEQKTGDIRIIENGELLTSPFLHFDEDHFRSKGWEQGMLGMALDPAFAENKQFYLNYTDPNGDTTIARFTADTPRHTDVASEELILSIDQPFGNHNGGCIRFGPDGYLYIGLGDGGSANDPDGNGQNKLVFLGKMLRIDVSGPNEAGQPYRIPKDNPYAYTDDAQPEIWAVGLRNPWKFEFDSKGRLWIADVGQNKWEWILLQSADSKGGENYGWNAMEGPEPFDRRPEGQDTMPDASTITAPIYSYRQSTNNPTANNGNGDGSITGGYFYENDTIPSLKDRYIFADFMTGRIWSFKVKKGKADDVFEHTAAFASAFPSGAELAISSFAKDNQGELYMIDHKTGTLIKIVP